MNVQTLMKDMEKAYNLPFNTPKCIRTFCNLVLKFSSIDPDDMYSILIDEIPHITNLYNGTSKKELHMNMYYAMRWACLNVIRNRKLQKNDGVLVSINAPCNEQGESFSDIIGNDAEIKQNEMKDFYLFILNQLDEREKIVSLFHSQGMTGDEIAENIGCSRQNVYLIIDKIKNKMKKHKNTFIELLV